MITEILGKISITPKGQWVAGTYERLDLVTDAGSSYISLKDNNVSALNTADWMLVASKGDPFLYSDFTPEQIAELQRPATDAANNANAKATLANDAAILANEKAGLADTAATNADNARLAIQDDLGLKLDKTAVKQTTGTSETDVMSQKAVTDELALKEATANKQNSLVTDGTGVKLPTVDAVNAGLALKANKVQEEWITPTLINGWVSAPGNTVMYMKDTLGFVHVKGRAMNGSVAAIFTLPTGYRPNETRAYAVPIRTNGTFMVRIDVSAAIFSTYASSGDNHLDLSVIIFKAEL